MKIKFKAYIITEDLTCKNECMNAYIKKNWHKNMYSLSCGKKTSQIDVKNEFRV